MKCNKSRDKAAEAADKKFHEGEIKKIKEILYFVTVSLVRRINTHLALATGMGTKEHLKGVLERNKEALRIYVKEHLL